MDIQVNHICFLILILQLFINAFKPKLNFFQFIVEKNDNFSPSQKKNPPVLFQSFNIINDLLYLIQEELLISLQVKSMNSETMHDVDGLLPSALIEQTSTPEGGSRGPRVVPQVFRTEWLCVCECHNGSSGGHCYGHSQSHYVVDGVCAYVTEWACVRCFMA